MSASDLPEMGGYDSSLAMARTLVTYMADPDAVYRAIKNEFPHPPATRTIAKLRADHLKSLQKGPAEPHQPCDGYWPAEAVGRAERASQGFLKALDYERALSAARAKAQGALDSPALRHPAIVDKVWETETELAWRQNGELP